MTLFKLAGVVESTEYVVLGNGSIQNQKSIFSKTQLIVPNSKLQENSNLQTLTPLKARGGQF